MTIPTAGELANKALNDTNKYDARELALEVTDDLEDQLYQAVSNYESQIPQQEFCVVMIIASDPLIHNLKRRKFYCWPWLPSPRPNQAVFLYNKSAQRIIRRLWVLPCAQTMAELADSRLIVDKRYTTMQAWSKAFFKGNFWDFIREDQGINMLSQQEYFDLEGIQNGDPIRNFSEPCIPESFDFSKISCGKFENSKDAIIMENS